MKEIDVETWNRKDLFRFFRGFEQPHFNITANVDVSRLKEFTKKESLSFSLSALHSAVKSANSIPEFRTRIIDGKVVEFGIVHGSQPIMLEDESFLFCLYEYCEDVHDFDRNGRVAAEQCKSAGMLDGNPERLDQIFFSVIPWVSFTSFKNAQRRDDAETVPRIVFGKVFERDGRHLMPVSVEVHHALVDGLHVGRFFERFQNTLDSLV